MKKTFFIALFSVFAFAASAQMANPVSWTFASKKISENIYEVQAIATIQSGWHLYSQSQPKDAIAQPTKFQFAANPLVQLNGKVKEVGKLEKFTDKELDLSAYQYSRKVVFTQKVLLKGKTKSNVGGAVTFQTCDDKKCLPPKTVNFSVTLK